MSRGLPILMYHSLDSSGSAVSTAPRRFASTMRAFHAAGFRTVHLDDWLARGRPRLDRAFAITFDDGLRSILPAAEILAPLGFHATAFLATARMGLDNAWPGQPRGIPRMAVMRWSDAATLRDAGFRFGAHSRNHPRLDRLRDDALMAELRGSREDVERRLGAPCPLLAYPYGVATPRVRAAASEVFDAAFTTDLRRAGPDDDPLALPRIDAREIRSPRALAALLDGREGARFLVRRALRATRAVARPLLGA